MSKMMRISIETANSLEELAKETGKTKQFLLEKAVQAFSRELFFRRANADYARLKKDPQAWKEYMKEFKEWDVALQDGLEDE